MNEQAVALKAAMRAAAQTPAALGLAPSKTVDEIAREAAAGGARQNGGIAIDSQGRQIGYVHVDPTLAGMKNKTVQFDVTNGAVAAYRVRIGGYMGIAGKASLYGIAGNSACDTANVSDQGGANVIYIQGFSQLTCSVPLFIEDIKVTTSDAVQLIKPWTYREIQWDFTSPKDILMNIADEKEITDQRTDMLTLQVGKVLDAMHWLDFEIKVSCTVSLILTIGGIGNIRAMTEF